MSTETASFVDPIRHQRLRGWPRGWLRAGVGVAGTLLLLTGLMGVLHLPFAAPLLRRIMPGSVCPIMRGTPAQIDRAHAIGAAAIRGGASAFAPTRRALGFQLDRSRKADFQAWASTHAISCAGIARNDNLQKCTNLPPAAVGEADALGPLEEVTFEFKASGELVNVQTLRRHLTPVQAALTVGQLEQVAGAALGPPSTVGGEPTVAHLSRGLLATYVAVHLFKDYRATVSATNLAPTGLMVREEYLSTL
jgi:hypothetical protein